MRLKGMAGIAAVVTITVIVAMRPEIAAATAKARTGREVVWPTNQVKFEETRTKGVTKADLWGNAAKGAHGSLVKFAAGTNVPLHTHTNDIRAVVISGTYLYGSGGGPAQKLGPGSYLLIPGGVKHTSGCDAGADCLFFEEQSGKFDLKPVQAASGAAKAK